MKIIMKRKNLLFIAVLCLIVLFGCQNKNNIKDRSSDQAPFENAEWLFFNEVTGEHDVIYFGEDFSFSYHCQCGEPVGDSDCYDLYHYDEDNLVITLYNDYDDSEKKMKVLSYNVMHLLLEIDGVIRDFTTIPTDTSSNFWREQAESYLSGYEMNRTLVEFTDKGMMTAAVNYDTETNIPKGTLEEYALAEDAVFFDMSLFSQRHVEKDTEVEDFYDVTFVEINREDVESYFENGGLTVYLWLNDEMEIEKAIIWGITTVIE